jgi:phosphoglycolate phosphatase
MHLARLMSADRMKSGNRKTIKEAKKQSPKRVVIFDWSGTLSDNFHIFAEICESMFVELGRKPIPIDEIRRTFTLPYMKFWNTYFPKLTKEKQDAIYRKYIHKAGKPKIFPGTRKLIDDLHSKGFEIFIVSSDFRSTLIPEMKASGFIKQISGIKGHVHEKKYALKEIVNKNKLKKKETFYVGDTSGDIEAGKDAGLRTVGVTWGFQQKTVLKKSKPDFIANDVKELRKILLD